MSDQRGPEDPFAPGAGDDPRTEVHATTPPEAPSTVAPVEPAAVSAEPEPVVTDPADADPAPTATEPEPEPAPEAADPEPAPSLEKAAPAPGDGSLRTDRIGDERPTPPEPETIQVAAAAASSSSTPRPTATVRSGDASHDRPAGTAAPSGAGDGTPSAPEPALTERPEVMIAASFAGAFLFATILKRLGR